MRVAANLSMLFSELELAQRSAAAAIAGFDGVEIQFPYELPASVLAQQLNAINLPLVLINLPAGDLMAGGLGLACVSERQKDFNAALEQALRYAEQAEPLKVNVLAGRLAQASNREAALAFLAGNVRRAAEAFAQLDIRVVVEAINPLDMPGFLINTPEHLNALLQQVDHPNLAAQLDLYHMARQGIDPLQAIEQLAGRIGHVQFADYPGRGAPGSGSIDFSACAHALSAVGYHGWWAAEYRPGEAGTQASLAWLESWRLAER